MVVKKKSSAWVIGMALFAMFFGSGNLIYPLYLGQVAQASWFSVTVGFLLSAVLLPFCGVITMVIYEGDYETFFQSLGRRGGLILTTLLLTVWIPLGSGPRCITVAYAALDSYFSHAPPLWLFGIVYSLLVYFIVMRKTDVVDIIGRWMTPLLLVSLALICFLGIAFSDRLLSDVSWDFTYFKMGLVEGYNTMDLIASFFFSATVIHLLKRSGSETRESVSLVFRSSMIGMAILVAVYCPMIAVAAVYGDSLSAVPRDQLLPTIAQEVLGQTFSFAAIVAVVVACFSTSIALILAYVDFLHTEIFKQKRPLFYSVLFSIALTYLMSLFRLEGITFVTAPILQLLYPTLIFLSIFNLGSLACNRLRFRML